MCSPNKNPRKRKPSSLKHTLNGPYTLSTDYGDVLVTCRLRFINHSSNPNVVYYDDLTVVAMRDIAPGEELTHDYGSGWAEQVG